MPVQKDNSQNFDKMEEFKNLSKVQEWPSFAFQTIVLYFFNSFIIMTIVFIKQISLHETQSA